MLKFDFNLFLCQNKLMITDKIKNKLKSFVAEYQEKAGTFNGSLVIFEFIEFIKNEPTIKDLLKEQFSYCENQREIILKKSDSELDSIINNKDAIDPNNSNTWLGKDVFTKEHDSICDIIKNPAPYNQTDLTLPIYLTYLLVVHESVYRGKIEIKNNSDKSKKITQVIKDVSTASMPFKYKDKNEEKSLTLPMLAFCVLCLTAVCSYIFSELEKSEFLKGNSPKSSISFDPEESILYIRSWEIKITLKNDKPIDHYILEAIFSKEDLSEQADFKEISEDIIKEEYNGKWERFRHACDKLNQKIFKATDNKISDFIEYTTGKTGWCKINQKYL